MTLNGEIFNLGLSVGGTSLYLLLEGLASGGLVEKSQALSLWNSGENEFTEALEELAAHGIIHNTTGQIRLAEKSLWKRPKPA